MYLFIYIDITDITEQRVLQKKLEERSELLRNALEMAERANRAKSDFLSRMSHDIRTPMNAIMGMLSIAKESWDDPDRVRDCLDKVENSARFLLALINDILDMSKIESGKAILKKKAFDFAAFTRNLAAMFYGQAEKKQVRFQVLLGRSLAEAYVGDELKLNQIDQPPGEIPKPEHLHGVRPRPSLVQRALQGETGNPFPVYGGGFHMRKCWPKRPTSP